ncbi:MAG: PaaI family thioesterase [Pseudobutyrivibrio sp.]|jgi:acyl-CoA thioesterase|uniref:Phenylacetic acid degradation-related protein n=2 Tax=Pseudobutyrivibrio TaxID=46205 RepID=A0A2G3DU13_9FIRM|nr:MULTISPECIES: PaaI family thioesterase [Pseudobutyrivibrio]MBE5904768.1 PaaI family thioesterase [Pseudobutyrivibrio sp.]NEX02803.1 PaaI family thioesterase [Pseudobutyrivibrio xylanivorans]PHU34518.1 phenylacetic acid degradation-related protein [Pseudobutyrivibrio ruminis]PHU39562.1 phenylacetic acid degradation-related protein [Pseudobutyrivibrio ruminis]SCY36502.1 acyl-CoA thioesterase [Pseudobutyrivibrio sp. AR14]
MSKELLEKLRRSYEANEFVKYNHIVIDDIEVSGATAHIDIVPETLNVLGIAHGGAHFSLADTCAGYSSRADGREYVTQQSNFYFLKGAKSGRITAKGNVIKRTRKFCVVDVDVTDDSGELVSRGTFNYYCVSE